MRVAFPIFSLAAFLPTTALAQAEEAAVQQVSADAITVSAERLQNFRGRWHLPDTGSATCEIRRSTGDGALDRLACAAIIQCVDENLATIARGRDRSVSRRERRARVAATRQTMRECSSRRLADLERKLDD